MFSKKNLPLFLNYLNIESISPITGDGGHRTYYRVTTQDKSYVLMYDVEVKHRYKINQKHDFSFVNVHSLLEQNNISVPSINKIFKEESCILLEDLGNFNLYNIKNNTKNTCKDGFKDITLKLYKQSIDELIKIQSIKKDSSLTVFKKSFDVDFLMKELTQSLIAINNFYFPKNKIASLSKTLTKEITEFCNFLSQSSFCLVHRDYHSRNIMFKNKQIKIIDFQDARLGHPLYDLSSLLEDPYAKLDLNTKNDLKKYFQKQSSSLLLNNFDIHYFGISIHRLLKAAASFINLSSNDNNKVHDYLIDLPYAVKQSYDYIMKLKYPELQIFIKKLCNK